MKILLVAFTYSLVVIAILLVYVEKKVNPGNTYKFGCASKSKNFKETIKHCGVPDIINKKFDTLIFDYFHCNEELIYSNPCATVLFYENGNLNSIREKKEK